MINPKLPTILVGVKHGVIHLIKSADPTTMSIAAIQVQFKFEDDSEWENLQKMATFQRGTAAYSQLLDTDGSCLVPWEILNVQDQHGDVYFDLGVIGTGTGIRVPSNKLRIKVAKSCYVNGQTPQTPTQTVYEQIINLINSKPHFTQQQILAFVQTYLDTNNYVKKTYVDLHINDSIRHVTNTDKANWNAKAEVSDIPTKVSDLRNDVGYISTETDPTVPSWAKAATKPTYTKSEVGLGNVDNTSDLAKPISTATQAALNEKADSDDIPTKVSDLDNDAGYLTEHQSLAAYSLVSETGNKIDLEIDSSTYELTAKLYDKNNTLLSTSTVIDLPLEQLVVSVTFDSNTNELVITLKNGTVTRVPLSSIISGLATQAWVEAKGYLTQHQSLAAYRTSANQDIIDATKQDNLIAGDNIKIAQDGKTISSPNVPYEHINQVADYLFEVQYTGKGIDYTFANTYFRSKPPQQSVGACTGIVKNGRVLRQLDWTYDRNAEFIVRTTADPEKSIHSSIGVASGIRGLTKDFVESGVYSDKYKILPFIITDGINDTGLYIQSNVVTPLAFELNHGATNECCITMAVRYILDHCTSFNDVETFFNTWNIYGTSAVGYNYHFLLAQGNQWEVIELTASGHTTVTQGTNTNQMPNGIMTNFRTTGLLFTDGEVEWNSVETYGIGVERYDIATTAFTENKSLEELRTALFYTKTYSGAESANPWRTEFTDSTAGRTVMDAKESPEKYIQILQQEKQHYEDRSRDEEEGTETWQTVHSAIYDLSKKSFNIVIQENDDISYDFSLTDKNPKKVDKVTGKGLSTNDYTTAEKTKLAGISNGATAVSVSGTGTATDEVQYITIDGVEKKLGGVSDFEDLTNRPKYNGSTMDGDTNIPEVKTATWDAKTVVSVSSTGTATDEVKYITVNGVEKKIGGEEYTAGTGISITNNVISNDVSPLVPNQATAQNQLADKAFVNSSVQTATANFRGSWDTWANVPSDSSLYPEDYAGSKIPTVNDYLVVQDASECINASSNIDLTKIYQITKGASSYLFTLTYPDGTTSSVQHVNTEVGQPVVKYLGKNSEFVITAIGNASHEIRCAYKSSYNNTIYTVGSLIITSNYYTALSANLYLPSSCQGTWRFKYSGVWSTLGKSGWLPEYQVNEEPLTAAQIASLNSGATSTLIGKITTNESTINGHIANTSNPHSVTAAQVGLEEYTAAEIDALWG